MRKISAKADAEPGFCQWCEIANIATLNFKEIIVTVQQMTFQKCKVYLSCLIEEEKQKRKISRERQHSNKNDMCSFCLAVSWNVKLDLNPTC